MGRTAGITEAQLRDLPRYRESDAFSPLEKLVIDYGVVLAKTPVEVPDELFTDLRQHFDEEQIIELTAAIAWENYRARFNRALHVAAQDFSAGAFCPLPEGLSEAHPG